MYFYNRTVSEIPQEEFFIKYGTGFYAKRIEKDFPFWWKKV